MSISVGRFLFLAILFFGTAEAASQPSVAFYYGASPPLAQLQAFDIAVVEPDHVPNPRLHARAPVDGVHELFAYVSLGEVVPSRSYYASLPPGTLRTDNAAWGSKVIDQTAPGWREFFLSKIIAPLWEKGWRGFFIDTLDSYQLFAKTDAERGAQRQALIGTLLELKRRYPEARLILNRGFELLPDLAPVTYAVAAESLYRGYDAGGRRYRSVSESDRAWLMGKLEIVRDQYHLPVIAIDYVDPNQSRARELARETANRIRAQGFIPWVADGGLNSIGVGTIELIPRKVLVLVDAGVATDSTDAQRFLGMPLNYLGLSYEIIDITRQPLPSEILSGRYAGIVTWFQGGKHSPAFLPWIKRQIGQGVRIAILDDFGFNLDVNVASSLGLQWFAARKPETLSIDLQDKDFIGFEAEAIPNRSQLQPVRLADSSGRTLLRLKDKGGNSYDAAALTAWGGFALSPFVTQNIRSVDQDRWVLQPLRFLQAALALPDVPVADVTTEGGRRMLLSHIDGDGFASHAEFPGAPFTGEVVRKEIIEQYRIPITVSVIEAETSMQGLYRENAPVLESLARRIFASPFVEAASHSYSHPFYWNKIWKQAQTEPSLAGEKGEIFYNLPVPNYKFDLTREVRGSMDYINRGLMPPGKKASIFLWTGDCAPPGVAVAETYRNGYLNMNGGDTLITNSNNTWTAIAAQGVRKDGWYQVYAPNQNENVYTNEWHGPYYGFQRVIETFKLTEAPYRFKPVDIYYHFYSASKPASLAALHKVYRWALTQPLTHVYASQYIRKVLDFENMTLARDLSSGDLLVRSGRDLRTLRLPPNAAVPSLRASSGVAGVAAGPSGQYLILATAETRLSAQQDAIAPVYIQDANGTISDLIRQEQGGVSELRFLLSTNGPAEFSLAQARNCSVTINSHAIAAKTSAQAGAGSFVQRFTANTKADDGISLTSHYAVSVRCAA
jgi:polysaccharide biosynthesis protein PelA